MARKSRKKSNTNESSRELEVMEGLMHEFHTEEVRWTEGYFLQPEYLHLHEVDIPGTSDYRMTEHLAGFLASVPQARGALEEVVFCYSYEKNAENGACSTDRCTGQQFFSFRIEKPYRFEDSTAIEHAIMPDNPRSRLGAPSPRPLLSPEHHSDIVEALSACDLMQPYLLFSPTTLGVEPDFELVPVSVPEIQIRAERFSRKHGDPRERGYQFSWYGYRFQEKERQKWLTSPARLLYLQVAFLHHIHKWNFSLRKAHRFEQQRRQRILEVQRLVGEAEETLDKINAILPSGGTGYASVAGDSILSFVSPPGDGATDSGEGSFLFRAEWGHSIRDFPKDRNTACVSPSFLDWIEMAKRFSTDGRPNDLREFLEACGVQQYLGGCGHLSNEQRLSWERNIFCAAKILARTRPQDRKVAADQLSLAVLFGLWQASASDVSVTVRYEIRASSGIKERGLNPRTALNQYFRIDGALTQEAWPDYAPTSRTDGEMIWQSSGRTALAAFVRSGLLRSQDRIEASVELPNSGIAGPAHLLAAVASAVVVLTGGRAVDSDAHIVDANVTAAVMSVNERGKPRIELSVRLTLDRKLPDSAISGDGDTTKALRRMQEPFAYHIPVEASEEEPKLGVLLGDNSILLRMVGLAGE